MAEAAPATPQPWNGPMPKISSGETKMASRPQAVKVTAGVRMSPPPRITLASPFMTHMNRLPPNSTLEYSSAASSAAPCPPMAL